jgi:glycerol-3-phosphate cytidylyltransferase
MSTSAFINPSTWTAENLRLVTGVNGGFGVFTAGSFDLFHAGHANFLHECSRLGGVTVGLNSDRFILSYKGAAPVVPYEHRKAVLKACRYVSSVIENDARLDEMLLRVRPKYLAIGSDWARKNYYEQIGVSQDWLDEQNITLVYVPRFPGISTTELRSR